MRIDEVIVMARKAGFSTDIKKGWIGSKSPFIEIELARFADLVAKRERDVCVQLASYKIDPRPVTDPDRGLPGTRAAIEAVTKGTIEAIRARDNR